MSNVSSPYRGKHLDDYKVQQEVNLFFDVYDRFSGDLTEEEELEMYEDSFRVHTREKKRAKRMKRQNVEN